MPYRFYCDFCNFNQITETDSLPTMEYKRNDIQNKIPVFDPKTKKIIPGKTKSLPKMYKCPGCGRWLRPVKLKDSK